MGCISMTDHFPRSLSETDFNLSILFRCCSFIEFYCLYAKFLATTFLPIWREKRWERSRFAGGAKKSFWPLPPIQNPVYVPVWNIVIINSRSYDLGFNYLSLRALLFTKYVDSRLLLADQYLTTTNGGPSLTWPERLEFIKENKKVTKKGKHDLDEESD